MQNVILGLASALPALVLLAVIVISCDRAASKTPAKSAERKFAAQQEPPQDPKP